MSNSSRKRSSVRISKDHVRESIECKSEKVESGDKSRKKSIEQKVLNKNVKGVKDLDPNTSVCSSKDPVQRSINCKSKSSRTGNKSQEKSLGCKVLSDIKSIKDASSDTRIKRHKKENESKGRQNFDTVSLQNKSNQNTKKQSQRLVVGSKETDKIKKKKESGDNECDFSKIENMIFEDHLDKGNPVKKRIASQGEKGKISKQSGKVTKNVRCPREISNSDRKSKTSLQVTGKSKGKTTDMARKHKKAMYREKNIEKQNASESDSSDWEEVDESYGKVNEMEALLDESRDNELLKKTSVKIELDAPDVLMFGMKRRKKRRTEDEMIEEYLRKHLNRSIKEVHENMHKTHILCLFAHGLNVNRILNSEILLGAALSLITDKNVYPPKRLDMSYLEKYVNWFSRKIKVKIEDLESNYWSLPLESLMVKRFENKNALSNRELVYMFVIMSRALGMNVRLVLSLQPMSWKPSTDVLLKRLKKEEEESKSSLNEPSCSKASNSNATETQIRKKVKDKNSRKMLSSDSDVEIQPKKKNVMKNNSKDICSGSKSSKMRKKRSSLSDGSDSDFDPGIIVKKSPKLSVISKKRKSIEGSNDGDKKRKLNGKNDIESKKRKSDPLHEWAEVYVEEEEKWICIDITKVKIHCIAEIENRSPSSSAYITAYSANLTVKDVTRRYIASWLSKENKMRCCTKWWEKSLQPFRGKRSRLDKEEDNEMDQNLRQQPLPKVIGEYKNHPLYALQRHLLKFEAIYPPDESPVGYLKGEPVYPRSSVYTLCSRDTWVKEAKTVRVGEEPYKIVKARPKWDRNTCQVIKDRPLEVFGEWQVEDYEPPVASGGKVPRNEYGNVELFKPTMLPRGCVHLTLPSLNRVARKLNIDCAAAMVGFDFHSGWTHPVYDGFVVCEEFKEVLLDAWNQEQDEQAKRAEEKRQKRVYDNWKKLIRGMMVKDRIRQTYGNVKPPEDDKEDQTKVKTPDECENKTKEKEKSRIKGEKKNELKKTKVTQDDIDAARPPLITHTVKNLKIDLSSNVVDMAKESRRKTMKTSNSVKVKVKREKKKSSQPLPDKELPDKESNLDNSSDETDEEEKKEKIRAILNWGARTITTNPDLSDDSDIEGDVRPSCARTVTTNPDLSEDSDIEGDVRPSCSKTSTRNKLHANTISYIPTYKKPKTRHGKHVLLENCTESRSSASSCSTTPEPCAEDLTDLVPRRVSRRSRNANTGMYAESDGDNEGDISLDESDLEDQTYKPLKEKKKTLSESD